MDRLLENTRLKFRRRFGRTPGWLAAAPGRVNLIGEHTDYNDGFVLPMAIDGYVVLAADRSTERSAEPSTAQFHLYSEAFEESAQVAITDQTAPRPGHWSNYFAGVLVGCRQRGMSIESADVLIESTVPVGGGLSSSAALEVATATLVEAMTGVTLPQLDKALLCQRAEHTFAGTPCGIMDQFSSIMAQPDRLMLLDCRSLKADMVPFNDPNVTVLIINSNVRHELAGGEYAARRDQCRAAAEALGVARLRDVTMRDLESQGGTLDPLLLRRARHVVSENERTMAAARAISSSDWSTVGQLMDASHRSLRDDFEVSCQELDLLVHLAQQLGQPHGVYGSRMTGGGFGGSTVSLVGRRSVLPVIEKILDLYHRETGRQATAFTTRPTRGAFAVRVDDADHQGVRASW
ncbi:MAG: galactokinase [Pirellulales bacterium]